MCYIIIKQVIFGLTNTFFLKKKNQQLKLLYFLI